MAQSRERVVTKAKIRMRMRRRKKKLKLEKAKPMYSNFTNINGTLYCTHIRAVAFGK